MGFVKKPQNHDFKVFAGNLWKDKTRNVSKTTYHKEINREHPKNLSPKQSCNPQKEAIK